MVVKSNEVTSKCKIMEIGRLKKNKSFPLLRSILSTFQNLKPFKARSVFDSRSFQYISKTTQSSFTNVSLCFHCIVPMWGMPRVWSFREFLRFG